METKSAIYIVGHLLKLLFLFELAYFDGAGLISSC